ncbi:MAG: TfoX/Sxy family protein [Thermoplasmata archaeon]|nr:TfoX/Sxy family protein [Thermoplasmata archaeon]
MKIPGPTAEAAKRFQELVPSDGRVSVRKMFGQPSAFVNGNLFMGVFGPDLFVRLSKGSESPAERPEGARAFEPMPGRPMRGYFVLPAETLRTDRKAKEWVARALEFGGRLPPKKPGR